MNVVCSGAISFICASSSMSINELGVLQHQPEEQINTKDRMKSSEKKNIEKKQGPEIKISTA